MQYAPTENHFIKKTKKGRKIFRPLQNIRKQIIILSTTTPFAGLGLLAQA